MVVLSPEDTTVLQACLAEAKMEHIASPVAGRTESWEISLQNSQKTLFIAPQLLSGREGASLRGFLLSCVGCNEPRGDDIKLLASPVHTS